MNGSTGVGLICNFDSSSGDLPPRGGDASALCHAFGGSCNAEEVERVLRQANHGEGGYLFAFQRHAALMKALGLPHYSVGLGFNYLSAGDLPPDVSKEDFPRI